MLQFFRNSEDLEIVLTDILLLRTTGYSGEMNWFYIFSVKLKIYDLKYTKMWL